MNPSHHRESDDPLVTIDRKVPLYWLLTLAGTGAVAAATLFITVQNQGKTIEQFGQVQERRLTDLTNEIKELRSESRQAELAARDLVNQVGELRRRVERIESRKP